MTSTSDLDAVIGLTVKAAEAYGRPDLAADASALSEDRPARVVVAGEFKRGKSTLVNALLNAKVCSTDETVGTANPTVVRHGNETRITVVRDGGEASAGVAEMMAAQADPSVQRIEVDLDRPLLGLGLEIVDCPAAAGEGHPGRAATLAAATEAEATLYVTDASQSMVASELDLLTELTGRCPTVVVVMTKTDLTPDWRDILAHDRATLDAAGLPIPVVPVSSIVREAALLAESAALNEESGFTVLIDLLRNRVAGRAGAVHRRRVAATLGRIAGELEAGLRAEFEHLSSPEAAAAAIEVVDAARRRAEALRSSTARWQRSLAEGASDLQVSIDRELTEGVRTIVTEAEDMLDELDPAKDWETFEPWLRERLAATVEHAFARIEEGLAELAAEVARLFAEEEIEIDAAITGSSTELTDLDVRDDLRVERTQVLGNSVTALRGGYSGLLMFGMLGSMFGFALLNPVTIVLGIGLGGKAVFDERTRMLKNRRQKALQSVRQYSDRAGQQFRSELRATVTGSQRRMRDDLSAHVERMIRAADDALTKARASAQADATERSKRRTNLDAELRRVSELQSRIGRIAPQGPA